MNNHIIKVKGNITKKDLEELVKQLEIGGWMPVGKNDFTIEVIENGKTLREEIIAIIWGTIPRDSEVVANKVISIIEKRIDEIVEEQIEDAKFRGNEPEIDSISVDKPKEMLK